MSTMTCKEWWGSMGAVVPMALVVAAALVMTAPRSSAQAVADPHAAPTPEATHAPAPGTTPDAHEPDASHGTPVTGAPDAAPHAADASHDTAGAGHATGGGEHGESHGESLWVTLARLGNFAILAGVIYWFARQPLAEHLASRRAQIRKDLVGAAEMKTAAAARLADIETKLAALPEELDQLRRRGAEELEAERTRIRAAAESERDRLVSQARREIAMQARNARGVLRAHAATLAVDVAASTLRDTLTPAEQDALVTRYAGQLRNVQ